MAKHFVFPNFATPVPGKLREVLDNSTTKRDKGYLKSLNITKVESVGVYITLKEGMEVEDYNIFN